MYSEPTMDKVNWVVAGIGDIARRRVLPAILAEPRSTLYGLVTREPAKAAEFGDVRVWREIEAAVADPAVDAVYLALPVAMHAPAAEAALRAGKHVLSEKPMAMNHAEAQRMTATARTSGRLLGAAYYRRLFPKLARARQLIDEGVIGTPVLVEASSHGWENVGERTWLLDPALAGGGPLYDVGSHRIDAMNFLFGKPEAARGMISNAVHRIAVEDAATVLLRYAGGVHGIVDARWNSHVRHDEFRVIGTEGELDLDPLSGPQLRLAGRVEELPAHANVHFPLVANFVDAVLAGDPGRLACPGEEAGWTDWAMEQAVRG